MNKSILPCYQETSRFDEIRIGTPFFEGLILFYLIEKQKLQRVCFKRKKTFSNFALHGFPLCLIKDVYKARLDYLKAGRARFGSQCFS